MPSFGPAQGGLAATGFTLSGGIIGPEGSASAVAFGLGGATSGIFSPGSGYISFSRLGTEIMRHDSAGLVVHASHYLGFGSSGIGSPDVTLYRDAAAVLALKNGTTAQTFRVYGTTAGPKYTFMNHDGSNGQIDVSSGGGVLLLGGNASVIRATSGIDSYTDNGFDIGGSSNAFRTLYIKTSISAPACSIVTDTSTGLKIGTGTTQKIGFYNATPVALQTGVAVSAAGIHAALVNLGLITA